MTGVFLVNYKKKQVGGNVKIFPQGLNPADRQI